MTLFNDSNLPIKTLDIELSGSCNYTCRMCPQGEPGRDPDFLKNMPWELFVSTVDQCRDLGLERVRLHGSGEPTLYKQLDQAVAYCSQQGLETLITTNGSRLTSDLSDRLIEAGLTALTVSAIGSTREKYHHWMSQDNFDLVREQVRYYNQHSPRPANLYHLITEPQRITQEIQEYRDNWEEPVGGTCEIWHMHNWSGSWNNVVWQRSGERQRSCGRMFQPVLEVRAGGVNEHRGAVVACCMVLGNDARAVLGHVDEQSVADIWAGPAYQHLRQAHAEGRWSEIDYCRGCDQLYDRPDSLVYSTVPEREYGRIKFLS